MEIASPLVVVLSIVALLLLAWLIYHVNQTRTLATADTIALLAVVVSLAGIVVAMPADSPPETPTPSSTEIVVLPSDTPISPTEMPSLPTETLTPPTEAPSPPTETPSPPTETPSPPTETPSPPTETPSLPTETPSPPTETPSPPTETPSPPTETPSPPTETPIPPIASTEQKAATRNLDGLLVTVRGLNFLPGCDGTLGFEVELENTTSSPILLGLNTSDIILSGDNARNLSVYADEGAASSRCYGGLDLSAIDAGATMVFAVRTQDDIADFNRIQFTFDVALGRLAGQSWELNAEEIESPAIYSFGETGFIDGLEVTVGEETYSPGCDGSLGFQIRLTNNAGQPLVIGLKSSHLELYGDADRNLNVYSELGALTSKCYNGFNLQSIDANQTKLIAVRTTTSLSDISVIDFVFQGGGRLYGTTWRLELPR